jgi:PKD repeat protein
MSEAGGGTDGGAPRTGHTRLPSITATLAALVAVSCLLGGCVQPEQNILPEARFSCTPTAGNSPLSVSFDASGTEDTDGEILTYDWDFGDGGAASGVLAYHTYTVTAAQTFAVTLTVTDDQGGASTANASITVSIPTPQPPPPSQQYVASKNSDVFHRLGCSYVAQINSANRVYFATRGEALGSGRRPCSHCNP